MEDNITRVEFQNKLKMLVIKLLHFGLSLFLFAIAWLAFRYHGVIDMTAPGFRYNVFEMDSDAVLCNKYARKAA